MSHMLDHTGVEAVHETLPYHDIHDDMDNSYSLDFCLLLFDLAALLLFLDLHVSVCLLISQHVSAAPVVKVGEAVIVSERAWPLRC